jgi:LysM repeat protein
MHAPAKKYAGYYYYYYDGGRYCVSYGDTLYNIGYRHGVSSYAIAKANGIYNANYIRVGQCLTIPRW